MKSDKDNLIPNSRMRDLVTQLADIIYMLCDIKERNTTTILRHFTDMTEDEQSRLNIFYKKDEDED